MRGQSEGVGKGLVWDGVMGWMEGERRGGGVKGQWGVGGGGGGGSGELEGGTKQSYVTEPEEKCERGAAVSFTASTEICSQFLCLLGLFHSRSKHIHRFTKVKF